MARIKGNPEPPVLRIAPALAFFCLTATYGAESYRLEEPADDSRPRQVTIDVAIDGKVKASAGPGKVIELPLHATATYRYSERRLTESGRDAAAFRSVRAFDQAHVQTQVGERQSRISLPENLRVIAAHGRREGLVRYCPSALMSRETLDLIEIPGDSLAALALLPSRPVEVSEEWAVPDWAVQMFTAVDAVLKSELKCTLKSVEDNEALVTFAGEMEGARLGAGTKITLSGQFVYSLEGRYICRLTLDHVETTSIGVVNPGLESKVHVTLDRALVAETGDLSDDLIGAIPLDPPVDRLPLVLGATPWGVRMEHDRQWHVFHTSFDPDRPVIILRLLEEGSLVSQCNLSLVPTVEAGQHTPLAEYEKNIAISLGEQFSEFLERGRVPSGDGRVINRVVARGRSPLAEAQDAEQLEMHWLYYLVTHPSGRQVSFVFAVEPDQLDRLNGRDLQLVKSLVFLEAKDRQASAR